MKKKSKLVQSLNTTTEREFDQIRALVPMTVAWEKALKAVILQGAAYNSVGFKKQKVYAKLKQIQRSLKCT